MASCDGGGFLDCVSVVDASRTARDMSRRGFKARAWSSTVGATVGAMKACVVK